MNDETILERISEGDVHAWLRAQIGRLSGELSLPITSISVTIPEGEAPDVFLHGAGKCGLGRTIAGAADSLKRAFPDKAQVAAEKRMQARRLLAEADSLSPEGEQAKEVA